MAKAKRKRKDAPARIDYAAPTPEQFAHGSYEHHTIAYRRIPVIVTLATTGKLSDRQFSGLCRYRDIGLKCDFSPIRDSCDFSPRGAPGDGYSPSMIAAQQEFGWLERELGSLQPIAYAIALGDVTPAQWAMRHSGSVMREKPGIGAKIIRWFEPRRAAHKRAMMDIRMAGERLAAAIGV